MANLSWLTKALNLSITLLFPDLYLNTFTNTLSSSYSVTRKIKYFYNFNRLTVYFYARKILCCYAQLVNCKYPAFKLAILNQFTSNTTRSFTQPTFPTLAYDGSSSYTISVNNSSKAVSFCNLPSTMIYQRYFNTETWCNPRTLCHKKLFFFRNSGSFPA